MADAPDDAVDRLYGLPLDAFVAERDALAKALRGDGRRDEAAAVKKLAKPSVAAWAVNQAVRTQGRSAKALFERGDALARAQRDVLAGKGSGADLRAALQAEREAVEVLVEAARGLMTSAGADLSETTIERVRETLHAAALDSDAREDVAAGVVTRERVAQGLFGGDAPAPTASAPVPAPATKPVSRAKKADGAAKKKGADAAARKEAQERRARERDEREREAARRKVHERERASAAKRVARAEKAAAAAGDRVTELEGRLGEARAERDDAERELGEARERLAELDG